MKPVLETAPPSTSKWSNTPRWFFWMILGLIIPLDQWSKWQVEKHFDFFGQSHEIIPDFFHLTYVKNDGMAFGLMQGNNIGMGIVVSLILIGGIIYSRTLNWRNPEISFIGGLIISGAIGNLIDRVRVGYVIDFLDFFIRSYHWPAFNVADSCITISMVWIFFRLLFFPPPEHHRNS